VTLRAPPWQAPAPQRWALGESPFWHPQEQRLYWLDIAAKKVLRANADLSELEQWDMPTEPGCMAPAASGGLVIALRHGVFRAPRWGGALELLAVLPYDSASVRANDGKCDALGRFWIGTVDESKSRRAAALFCLDARAGQRLVLRRAGDALTANGLAWSPSGQTLYWADTPTHRVSAWNMDMADASLSGAHAYLEFPGKPTGWTWEQHGYQGRPDGATVDALGNYWVALYEGRRVCQFDAAGRLLAELEIPALCPTMPCLGGADLKTLYCTSARQGRSAEELARYPLAGAVFCTRVETPGLPVAFFIE